MWQYRLKRSVSLATAKQWMKECGFHWTVAHAGQYVDGHRRENVLNLKMQKWMAIGGKLVKELSPANLEKHTIVCSKTPTPQPKGKGSSLMVADFMSTDYGWLHSPDRHKSTRVLFCAGKSQDGYFSNQKAICHAKKAMAILEKYYPHKDHGCKKWGVDVPIQDTNGRIILGPTRKALMIKAWISNGLFEDGTPQKFYWLEGHEHTGKFKQMAQILSEQVLFT
ncbi:hypothetical protein J3A83DRAFT_4360203 [Scleroderma citrinum]